MEHVFENSRAKIGALKNEIVRVDFYKRLYGICSIINCSGKTVKTSHSEHHCVLISDLGVFWVDNAQTGFSFIQSEPNKFSNCFKIFGKLLYFLRYLIDCNFPQTKNYPAKWL